MVSLFGNTCALGAIFSNITEMMSSISHDCGNAGSSAGEVALYARLRFNKNHLNVSRGGCTKALEGDI